MMKKRILILHTSPTSFSPPWNEGLKNNLYAWIIDMRDWYDFDVISNNKYDELGNLKVHTVKNLNTSVIGKIIFTVQILFKARRLLRSEKYCTILYNINSYNILIFIFFLRSTYDSKKILILGSERLIKYMEEFKINFGRSPFFVKKLIFSYFDGVITISQKLKRELAELNIINSNKIMHYPALSYVQANNVRPRPRTVVCQEYRLNENKFYVTYIGNLHPTRGYLTLLDAFLKLKNKKIELIFCWNGIGDISIVEKFVERHDLINRVHILRTVNLSSIFSVTDAFVLPSIKQMNVLEYPLTILESLYFEKPVICTNQQSFMEIIEDGYNGLLFEPRNSDALSCKIDKLSMDKNYYKTLVKNARKSLEKLYDKDRRQKFIEFVGGKI